MVHVENLTGHRVWTFPKGHPEGEESDEQAALREVREETGWECKVEGPLTDVRYFYTHKRVRYNKTVRWFMMSPVRQAGSFQEEEVLEITWVPLEKAKNMIAYDSDKALIAKLETAL